MSKRTPTNVSASIRHRLLNLSKQKNEDFTLTLVRYVAERFLYRLSRSPHAERFVLKGALLLATRLDRPYRSTRDIDFLEYGEASKDTLARAMTDIARTAAPDDGLSFDLKSLRVEEIRENADYGGLRVSIFVRLAAARIPLQIDVGYGDVVVPGTIELEYPTLLGGVAPRIRAYPIETVIAEKVEAIVKLGMTNSRMKDYFDLWLISRTLSFEGSMLSKAFGATFERRGTELPTDGPAGLTPDFGEAPDNVKRWRAFVETNGLEDAPKDLEPVLVAIRHLVVPPLRAAGRREPFRRSWSPDGEWH